MSHQFFSADQVNAKMDELLQTSPNGSIINTDYKTLFSQGARVTHDEILRHFFGFGIERTRLISSAFGHPINMGLISPVQVLKFVVALPLTEYQFVDNTNRTIFENLEFNTGSSQSKNALTKTMQKLAFLKDSKEIADDYFEKHLSKLVELIRQVDESDCAGLAFQSYSEVGKSDKVFNIQLPISTCLLIPMTNFLKRLINKTLKFTQYNENQPGVHTELPDHTNSVLKAYPDMCICEHRHTIIVIEVKKPSILPTGDYPPNSEKAASKLDAFQTQLLSSMLSHCIDRSVLTDGFNFVLVKIDHDKVATLRETQSQATSVPLFYKLLHPTSSGITLRGGLLAFLYDCTCLSEQDYKDMKLNMNNLYKFVRKSNKQYFDDMHKLFLQERELVVAQMNAIIVHYQTVALNINTSFHNLDVQTGFNYNSQLLRLPENELKSFWNQIAFHPKVTSVAVKAFDCVKAKKFHEGHPYTTEQLRGYCLDNYLAERKMYERLRGTEFNSVYLAGQPFIFGWFEVDGKCHTMGPTLVLEFISKKLKKFPVRNKRWYTQAKKQLQIVHAAGITHNDICQRNIICTIHRVYLIDFGLSTYKNNRGEKTLDNKSEDIRRLKLAFEFTDEDDV